jgi:hypothetical protein
VDLRFLGCAAALLDDTEALWQAIIRGLVEEGDGLIAIPKPEDPRRRYGFSRRSGVPFGVFS